MLKTRIITSVAAIVLVGIVLFVLPVSYAETIIGLLLIGGAWEWSGFLGTDKRSVRLLYTALVTVALIAAYFTIDDSRELILQVACVWWFVAFFWNLRYPTPIPVAVRWVCGFLVLVPLYVALLTLLRLGVEYLLFALLIVWLADGGAYFAGKMFGRVKLAPAISPKKTWEGVVGGMLLVGVLATVVALQKQLDIAVFVPFCLAVAALSVVGDLTVSMFKRTANVKDSGNLFPGHGGILDRVDSVAAAAPMLTLGIHWLGIV